MVLTFSHFMPVALTWFVIDIFLDHSERRSPPAIGLIAFSVVVWMICLTPAAFSPLHVTMNIVLEAGLLYLVLVSAKDDLVERRRSFRVVFVTALLGFSISKVVLDATVSPDLRPHWFDTAYATAVLGFVIVFAHWALRPGGEIWVEDAPDDTVAPRAPDPADRHVLGLIDTAMRAEIWRQEGLTIGAMAQELGIPEHRLRKAINRDLGYRNFPAFVNGYRIEAAKAALAAPENAHRTILEIAYDVGFASLGPFNKTFRAITGTSPRDYRRKVLDDPSIPA